MTSFIAHLESRLSQAQARSAERAMREAAARQAQQAGQGQGSQGADGAQGAQGQGCCGQQQGCGQRQSVDPTTAGAQNQQRGEQWSQFANRNDPGTQQAQARRMPQTNALDDQQRAQLYQSLGINPSQCGCGPQQGSPAQQAQQQAQRVDPSQMPQPPQRSRTRSQAQQQLRGPRRTRSGQQPRPPRQLRRQQQPSGARQTQRTQQTQRPDQTQQTQQTQQIQDPQRQQTQFGQRLGDAAERIARRMGSVGRCAKGVNDALASVGVPGRGHAYQKAEQLANNPNFREVNVSRDQLANLPRGAVVVWGRNAAKPYGHVSVALGNGREASDHIQRQMTGGRYGTDFGRGPDPQGRQYRVFIPR